MAINYTYDDFTKALAQSGLSGQFSDADLRLAAVNPNAGMTILNAKIGYGNAASDAERASFNTIAENARRTAGGYTGGTDGSSYFLAPASPSSFTPKTAAPTYQNRYEDDIRAALSAVTNPAPFSYSAESDDVYKQYAKAYRREGQRATADTLGQAAAATGGIPSSYAATAAAQAGNYYAAQLADKIPELNQMAYQRYLNDHAMRQAALDALLTAEQSDYNKYLNDRSQYNADRSFDYNQFIDEITHQQNVEQRARDNRIADALTAAEYGDYSLLQALGVNTSAQERNDALAAAYTAAQYGDYSLLEALGINTSGLRREDEINFALNAAKYGDYSYLQKLGINVSPPTVEEEPLMSMQGALIMFENGNWDAPGVRETFAAELGITPEEYADYILKTEGRTVTNNNATGTVAPEDTEPEQTGNWFTNWLGRLVNGERSPSKEETTPAPEVQSGAYQNFISRIAAKGINTDVVKGKVTDQRSFAQAKKAGEEWAAPYATYNDYLEAMYNEIAVMPYTSYDRFVAHMQESGYDPRVFGANVANKDAYLRAKREGEAWAKDSLTYGDYLIKAENYIRDTPQFQPQYQSYDAFIKYLTEEKNVDLSLLRKYAIVPETDNRWKMFGKPESYADYLIMVENNIMKSLE